MSVRDFLSAGFYSLSAKINKRSGNVNDETAEGVVGGSIPELELDMDDTEMISLSNAWERSWNDSDVKSKWEAASDENEEYWKGEHFRRPEVDRTRAIVDNAIFEGLETYLPQVTRRNPEPMVSLAVGTDPNQDNQNFAHALQLELGELADELKLRLKLKGAARHHELYLLGAIKIGWNLDSDIPALKVVRPKKLILDPNATVDEDGYTGERLGEHRKLPASRLISIIKKEKNATENTQYITEKAHSELGTDMGFIEWWTPQYMFWKMDDKILMKRKNPHWNYDQVIPTTTTAENENPIQAEVPQQAPQVSPTLPQGAPALPQIQSAQQAPQEDAGPRKGINHFKVPKIPYVLMAVYTLGKQPVNVTSNIGQNLSNQDLINKRSRQIDKNADTTNGGMVVSLERSGLTKDQAKGVTTALRQGGIVAIPSGSAQDAVYKPPMYELPGYVYNQLVDTRNRVRDIWGTRGSSPAGLESDTTVRGKILSKTADTDRIGGGISEYLEQMADDVYNWLVQMLYVYDDRFVEAAARGVPIPPVKVSVKEGSLLPKDSTTIANQAIDLTTAGKMSILDMYKRLDYPNPEQLAANVWLEINAPDVLYGSDPRVAEVIKRQQAAAQAAAGGEKKPPSESINFKDLPPEGRAQMAKQAGIELHPEAIAAHDASQAEQEAARSVPAVPLPAGAQ